MTDMYDTGLHRRPANHAPLSPISFLQRAARIWPGKVAIIHGEERTTYAAMLDRCRRLASALIGAGVGRGDTVAILAPNVPAMLEAHFGVPMAGAVLCTINTRLDSGAIAFILQHSEAKIVFVDRDLAAVADAALATLDPRPLRIAIEHDGALDYETFLAGGDADFPVAPPRDEWDAIGLSYTSGTTGSPKGVVVHHRGAYLNSCSGALEFGLTPQSVKLWTLPMFHCNGWCYTWAVALAGGTHICLRRVDPAAVFELIERHGVTHMCGAPVVLTMLIHAAPEVQRRFAHRVRMITGGAAPPSAVIAKMEAMGFTIIHQYGLTETYGPSLECSWQPNMDDLPLPERAAFMARQGVNMPMVQDATVMDPATMRTVPADGKTMGEVMVRGNTVMKGYLKNPPATEAAFAGEWFHTGDLAVLHPDGYIEVKDRSKDIIISGGENISSLEVEEVLYQHPLVQEAAVVAHPDEKWGEVPHAFVTLRDGAAVTAEEIVLWCRGRLARFKAPKHVTFGPLPKTSTGKVQKFELRGRLI